MDLSKATEKELLDIAGQELFISCAIQEVRVCTANRNRYQLSFLRDAQVKLNKQHVLDMLMKSVTTVA